MKKIRKSVFETNSSSTHSISISANSNGILDTILPDENGNVILNGGQFGWEWVKFNDPLTKANYCGVDRLHDSSSVEMLKQVIKDHTGAKEVFLNIKLEGYDEDWSYIDHDSAGTSREVFKDYETLKNWIFNPECWLFLGNDNECPPPNFYDVKKNIKYRYLLQIEGLELTTKFEKKPSKKELKNSLEDLYSKHPLNNNSNYDNCYRCVPLPYGKNDLRKSFQKFDSNIIIVYKSRPSYGYKINDFKELKFTLFKI